MSNTGNSAPADILGPPKEFTLPRDNDLDVTFSGWLLECADQHLVQDKHGVTVCIYFTEGRSIVTHRIRWGVSRGERVEHHRVGSFEGSKWKEAVEWLKGDNSNRLGVVSKEAWVRACQKLPELAGHATERVK
jgi:hypothetical protein